MNELIKSIVEVLSKDHKNFLIQDMSDDSIAYIAGEVVKCEHTLMIHGVVMSKESMNELNSNSGFSRYLQTNNLVWLMSCDSEAHYSVIYMMKKAVAE